MKLVGMVHVVLPGASMSHPLNNGGRTFLFLNMVRNRMRNLNLQIPANTRRTE